MSHTFRNNNMVETIKCAGPGCHKTRTAIDPWFVTVIVRDVFSCRRYAPTRPLSRLEQPVCGQACAVRLFDSYLSGAHSSIGRTHAAATAHNPINTAAVTPCAGRASRAGALHPVEVRH